MWIVFLPFTVGSLGVQWIEPENSSLVNQLRSNGTTRYLVLSDTDPLTQFPTGPNGTGLNFGTFADDGGLS